MDSTIRNFRIALKHIKKGGVLHGICVKYGWTAAYAYGKAWKSKKAVKQWSCKSSETLPIYDTAFVSKYKRSTTRISWCRCGKPTI